MVSLKYAGNINGPPLRVSYGIRAKQLINGIAYPWLAEDVQEWHKASLLSIQHGSHTSGTGQGKGLKTRKREEGGAKTVQNLLSQGLKPKVGEIPKTWPQSPSPMSPTTTTSKVLCVWVGGGVIYWIWNTLNDLTFLLSRSKFSIYRNKTCLEV